MNETLKEAIWNQFGACIDMLINVVAQCPDDYFHANRRFFYTTFHSAVFLDYYLSIPPQSFSPSLPFTQKAEGQRPSEAIDDLVPDRDYTKSEIIVYIHQSREKCKAVIDLLTEEDSIVRFTEGTGQEDIDFPLLEILMYNLRHTQHHVAQLHMYMRQDFNQHMAWSFRVGDINLEK